MKVYGVIYALIDGTNGFEYIGQTTKTAEERFKEHMYSPHYIGNAIRKHGAENFLIVTLKECYSKAELDFWEKYFIKSRNTMAPNIILQRAVKALRDSHLRPKLAPKCP